MIIMMLVMMRIITIIIIICTFLFCHVVVTSGKRIFSKAQVLQLPEHTNKLGK